MSNVRAQRELQRGENVYLCELAGGDQESLAVLQEWVATCENVDEALGDIFLLVHSKSISGSKIAQHYYQDCSSDIERFREFVRDYRGHIEALSSINPDPLFTPWQHPA